MREEFVVPDVIIMGLEKDPERRGTNIQLDLEFLLHRLGQLLGSKIVEPLQLTQHGIGSSAGRV
ncbi:hypothetical protein D9M71_502190 [compost metagenome]